ncbi:MAG: HupE/UreJ family protein [Chitinophagaceae bacterium]|nr:HupE/UreJ family protein [Chitinophagaceae bacterium]
MQNLGFFFDLGWHHIMAWDALDHLLFILVLSAVYVMADWKKVLILVTAFTLGHSLTLILSIADLVRIQDKLVEILIPGTIIVTALFNIGLKDDSTGALRRNYFLAFFFGLIHGLGFANAIRFMMSKDDSIGMDLLGFNLGLEAGQIVVVAGVLVIGFVIINKARLNRKYWVWALSVPALVLALKMIWDRISSS